MKINKKIGLSDLAVGRAGETFLLFLKYFVKRTVSDFRQT
jgi:hypothetical protein